MIENRRNFFKLGILTATVLTTNITFAKEDNKMTNDILVANPSKEAARNAAKNPFGLVYDGAITKNKKGEVNIFQVSYKINDIVISANIYTPANFNPNKKYPAIVVAHPNGGVKEQVAGLYAQNLAQQGFVTISADAAYQGASGGFPRNVDKPANRIEDIRAMADFISTYQGVDSQNIGVLGICGGGGYTLKASQTDKRFKAVATLSMFDSGLVRRNAFLNSQIDSINKRLQVASKAREDELKGIVAYTSSAPKKLNDDELAKITTDLYRDGMVYYGDTHAHPNSSFAYTTSSLIDLMQFDAASNMDLLTQPFLMIVGEKADTLYMSEKAFLGVTNAKDKEFYKIKNATHIKTYYEKEFVEDALNKLTSFYNKNLK